MPCFFPLIAWKSRDVDDINGITGKIKMVFKPELGYPNTKTELPCGQCIGCKIERARQWAGRVMLESSTYQFNCFITLTYKEDPYSLNKEDIQRFLKTLRKKLERTGRPPVRFFQCGEYGEKFSRPHHHIILLNYWPPDTNYFKKHKGNSMFISKEITECWPHGQHSIGALNSTTANYTTKYCLKKIAGPPAEKHYNGRLPEFVTMSRNPGIAKDWFLKFNKDVYNHDKVILEHNHVLRPPRYFDSMYEADNPSRMRELKKQRREKAIANPDNCDSRRDIKFQLYQLKEENLKRKLESPHHPRRA